MVVQKKEFFKAKKRKKKTDIQCNETMQMNKINHLMDDQFLKF